MSSVIRSPDKQRSFRDRFLANFLIPDASAAHEANREEEGDVMKGSVRQGRRRQGEGRHLASFFVTDRRPPSPNDRSSATQPRAKALVSPI